MRFKDIKIANKLVIGFSSALFVSIIIGFIGYKGMHVIQSHLVEVSQNRLPSIHSLLDINESLTAIDASENVLLITNVTPELVSNSYRKIDEAKKTIEDNIKLYEVLPRSAEEDEVWKKFKTSKQTWLELQGNFMVMAKNYNAAKTVQKYNELSYYALVTHSVPFDKTVELLGQLVEINDKLADNTRANAEEQSNNAILLLITVILLGAGVSIILGVIISRAIARPLAKSIHLAEAVSMGDLTVKIEIDQKDEIGQLAKALATMVVSLKLITSDIKHGVSVLGTSSSEILTTVTEISTGAAETATSVSETTTTVEEVRQTAMVSNQKAQSLMLSSQKAADSVDKGRDSINEVIDSMKKIDNQMNLISETVLKLAEQNRTIGEITSSVADIADQSNLLAVNAAIEAAKAGEHGRGFTVVAQEIRSLADQSKKATAQVKEILNEINKSVNQAVGVTEQGSRTVEEGRRLVAQSGEVIEILSENVEEAAQAAIQISSSNQQQMAGMEQIVPAMENIKLASQQNVTGIKQAQLAAHDLNSLGQNLKDIIDKFKI